MEEENARLRAEMKAERDEANIKAHQIVERLTEEMHKQCEVQIEKLVTENTALKIAHRGTESICQIHEILYSLRSSCNVIMRNCVTE
ncbi:hypothetical protein Dimus_020956 [Dionaea muscipula]